LKAIVKKELGAAQTAVGDEGGISPAVDAVSALRILTEAIEDCGCTGKIKIAMDVAASEFYENGKYNLNKWAPNKGEDLKTTDEMIAFYEKLIDEFPIISIEDPLYEGDFEGHAKLTAHIGHKVQIVGDDLLVTNKVRIQKGIEMKSVNALLLKINQIGTISESIEAYQSACGAGWSTMVSHRSGETEDTFIADLVVALGTGQIKTGAPCRSERTAKYNRLLKIGRLIEESSDLKCSYAGPRESFLKK